MLSVESPKPADHGAVDFRSASILAVAVTRRQFRRQRVAAVAIVLASTLWIWALAVLGAAGTVWPWCLTFVIMSASALASVLLRGSSHQLVVKGARSREPVSFMESYAATYLALSLAMALAIVFARVNAPKAPVISRQVIDIELVSKADYKNSHDFLASSADMQAVRKRTSDDTDTAQGSLMSSAVPPSPSQTAPNTVKPPAPDSTNPARQRAAVVTSHPLPQAARNGKSVERPEHPEISDVKNVSENFRMTMTPPPVSSPQAHATRAPSLPQRENAPFLEEVAPPELVELTDNDGDQSMHVWQAGGRSSGGTGARSEMASYLKELHRRIKRAWDPPRGQSRKAEILFRIRRSGQLVSIRLINTSGDQDADTAAMRAVGSATPFKPLPAEYPNDYLDVRYSFNYNVDQLTEITHDRID